jgi:hypothetical protein
MEEEEEEEEEEKYSLRLYQQASLMLCEAQGRLSL